MKKIIVLVLAFAIILSVSACSNKSEKAKQSKDEEVIEEQAFEGKLVFNPKDLDSILKHVPQIVFVDGVSYKETKYIKGQNIPIPDTYYNVKRIKFIDKKTNVKKSLEEQLEKNKKSRQIIISGGTVTKAQWYKNLRDE